MSKSGKLPVGLRTKILQAAFLEFYTHGFQGGSVNRIIEAADTTKGAFFHHFENKDQIGYAVVDEVIERLMKDRWLAPIADSVDVIGDLKATVRWLIAVDSQSGSYLKGCPLNNFAQEMSPLDKGFQTRLDGIYTLWRESLAAALTRAAKMGQIRNDLDARSIAAFLVAAQMGIWGSAKSSRSAEIMQQAGEALCAYLDSLSLVKSGTKNRP